MAGGGNSSGSASLAGLAGFRNVVGGFDGGAAGTVSGVDSGGSGGGAGPEGVGGAGGNGAGGTGGVGGTASANTGAGGGGGGGGATGGAGGAGGSGKLYISYKSQFAYPPLPKLVQFAVVETSHGISMTSVFPNNVTAGNTIIVVCTAFGNTSPVVYNGPTDAEGNGQGEYLDPLIVVQDAANEFQGEAFYAFNVVGGTTNVMTPTYTGGAVGGGNAAYYFEVSGLLGYEGAATNSTGSIVANATTVLPVPNHTRLRLHHLLFGADAEHGPDAPSGSWLRSHPTDGQQRLLSGVRYRSESAHPWNGPHARRRQPVHAHRCGLQRPELANHVLGFFIRNLVGALPAGRASGAVIAAAPQRRRPTGAADRGLRGLATARRGFVYCDERERRQHHRLHVLVGRGAPVLAVAG